MKVELNIADPLEVENRHEYEIGERLDRRAGDVVDVLRGALGLARDVFDYVARRQPRVQITSVLVEEDGHFVALMTGDIREVRVDTRQKVTFTAVPVDRRGEPCMVDLPASGKFFSTDNAAVRLLGGMTQDPVTKAIEVVGYAPRDGAGVAAIEFNADPRLGPEVGPNPLHGGAALSWSPPEAVEVRITQSEPVDYDPSELPEEPVEPEVPTEPTEPEVPTEPTEPVTPVEPTEPEVPTEPETPPTTPLEEPGTPEG